MKTALLALGAWTVGIVLALADPPTSITNITKNGSSTAMRFPLSPATQAYTILSTTNLSLPFQPNLNFGFVPYYVTNIALGQPEVVLDNSVALFNGTWITGTSSTDKYGGDYRYKSRGSGSFYAQFTPTMETAGDYYVYEWHPQGSNRASDAPHIITHAAGTTTFLVNQKTGGGAWNVLGRFTFNAGASGNVRITDGFVNTNGTVAMADAIRFVGVGLPPKVSEIITVAGYEWRGQEPAPQGFHRLKITPMSDNDVLAATALQRLAYGPTPYELATLQAATNGAQTYIDQQLAPETLTETVADSHTNIAIITAKFAQPHEVVTTNHASIADLRAWHGLRAIGAKRQLLEVLLQFFENHFVTQYSKSRDYFAGKYENSALEDRLAAHLEFWENDQWRAVLLNPTGAFSDLLEISAKSPAMVLYLDTITSAGNGNNIANENYARELLELFTFGVDNGYDQSDITLLSRAWTGWRLDLVDPTNAFNPFALRTTNNAPGVTNNFNSYSNLLGCWALNFQSRYHYTNAGGTMIFSNKFIPERFGAPYTTQTYGTNTVPGRYQLYLPQRFGTNGMKDGFDVLQHIANLPFTQEYLSIKLCRLLVHDDFPNPSNDPESPLYNFYNYAAGNLSPEAQLVRQCMTAWENGNPKKGQIREVLRVIFASDLFRHQTAAAQKVKTPFEFVVSTVRALRTSTNGSFLPNTYSADSEGYALATPLQRMGGMNLFDRGDPDGYPESPGGWISAGTLAERIRFVQSFCIASGQSGHNGGQSGVGNDAGNSVSRPVDLLRQKFPSLADQKDAAKVADYVVSLIYPGEGAGNLESYQQAAVNFLNTADNGDASNFSDLVPDNTAGSPYDTRVRGMMGMLLSMPRFQEQ